MQLCPQGVVSLRMIIPGHVLASRLLRSISRKQSAGFRSFLKFSLLSRGYFARTRRSRSALPVRSPDCISRSLQALRGGGPCVAGARRTDPVAARCPRPRGVHVLHALTALVRHDTVTGATGAVGKEIVGALEKRGAFCAHAFAMLALSCALRPLSCPMPPSTVQGIRVLATSPDHKCTRSRYTLFVFRHLAQKQNHRIRLQTADSIAQIGVLDAGFPVKELKLFGSARSAGTKVQTKWGEVVEHAACRGCLARVHTRNLIRYH